MHVVGVIDLTNGRAVHARGGRRHDYTPVRAAAGAIVDGDPVALAREYIAMGVRELYVADLDAIAGGSMQTTALEAIATGRVPMMLDAGVTCPAAAGQASRLAGRVIVGLETLSSWDALDDICRAIGGSRVAFSVDVREGVPMGAAAVIGNRTAPHVAARAAAAGVDHVILIDLAQVGMSTGVDGNLLRAVRAAVPDVRFLAGGGIRGPEDLATVAGCGCDGALVATALHEGRLTLT